MVDTNRPVAWRVVHRRTSAVVGEYPTADLALAKCEELEPEGRRTYQYAMEPVRAADVGGAPNGK